MAAEPSTNMVEELPQMRREAVQLVRQAVGAGRRAYVLVNNRAEGNTPLTVEGLAGMLAKQRPGSFRSRAFTIKTPSEFPWRSRLVHNASAVAVFPSRFLTWFIVLYPCEWAY